MRVVSVTCPLPLPPSSKDPAQLLVSDPLLRAFHGRTMEIGAWDRHGKRQLSFCLEDTSGSPIALSKNCRAHVTQSIENNTNVLLKNCFRVSHLLVITSEWTVSETRHLGCRAKISVRVPPPVSWIAERYVAAKSEEQIQEFMMHVLRWSTLEESP